MSHLCDNSAVWYNKLDVTIKLFGYLANNEDGDSEAEGNLEAHNRSLE